MLKSNIKTYVRQNYQVMLQGDPARQLSKQEWRIQFLERDASESHGHITAEICARFCEHVSGLYSKVLKYQDI